MTAIAAAGPAKLGSFSVNRMGYGAMQLARLSHLRENLAAAQVELPLAAVARFDGIAG